MILIREQKRQLGEMRKIVANHLSNKRLKSRMRKETLGPEKGAENSTRLPPKGINKGTVNEIRRTHERVGTAHFHLPELH